MQMQDLQSHNSRLSGGICGFSRATPNIGAISIVYLIAFLVRGRRSALRFRKGFDARGRAANTRSANASNHIFGDSCRTCGENSFRIIQTRVDPR